MLKKIRFLILFIPFVILGIFFVSADNTILNTSFWFSDNEWWWTSDINFDLTGWDTKQFIMKIANNSSQTITIKLWFVDGTTTNDSYQSKACKNEWENQKFWQYVALSGNSVFSISWNSNKIIYWSISFPTNISWPIVGCVSHYIYTWNWWTYNILARKVNFMNINVTTSWWSNWNGNWNGNNTNPWNPWWWGWWGWSLLLIDKCPVKDCSSSYYDKKCWICMEDVLLETLWVKHASAPTMTCDVAKSKYTQEQKDAYVRSFINKITTISCIDNANINWPIIRSQVAKMISEFAINILSMKIDESKKCNFLDMAEETPEMNYYARVACKLWIMWLNQDWSPAKKFNPNDKVTRAQFGTMLSRILYWSKYNSNSWKRYIPHLNALKKSWFMAKIDNPDMKEIRWFVMIMLKRVFDK